MPELTYFPRFDRDLPLYGHCQLCGEPIAADENDSTLPNLREEVGEFGLSDDVRNLYDFKDGGSTPEREPSVIAHASCGLEWGLEIA